MGHKELNVIYKSDISKASSLMIILFRNGVDVCHHATQISWLTPFLERNDNGRYEEAWVYEVSDYYKAYNGWVIPRNSSTYKEYAFKEETERKSKASETKAKKGNRIRISTEDLSAKEKLKREKRKARRLARKARLQNGIT